MTVSESDPSYIPVLGLFSIAVPLLVFLYEAWRRGTERKCKVERAGNVLLPTPHSVLPSWFGGISGHTLRLDKNRIPGRLEEWADEYGQDFELNILNQRAIVVIDRDEIRRILNLRPGKFRRGLYKDNFVWVGKQIGFAPSMFHNEGQDWGRSRRIIAPSFHRQNVDDMIPSMTKVAERLLLRWSNDEASGEVVDAKDNFGRFAHDVIALAGMGIRTNSVDVKKGDASPTLDGIKLLSDTTMKLLFNPLAPIGWKFFPSLLQWVRRTKEITAKMEETVQAAVDKTRAELKQEDDSNGGGSGVAGHAGKILRKIVSAGGRVSSGNRMTLSDEEVIRELKTIFLAGTDTTANTLTWAFYYVAKHPEIVARCRKEALEVAPDTNGLVSTPEQLSRLVFCSSVFREALRMWTAGLVVLLHSTEEFTMKNGAKTDGGTVFFLMNRYAAISEQSFTRAKEFIPERWIEAEREEALLGQGIGDEKRTVRHIEEAFMPFGGGPRVCPGKDMAMYEATVMLAAACAKFNFALAPGQADPPEENQLFSAGPRELRLVLSRA